MANKRKEASEARDRRALGYLSVSCAFSNSLKDSPARDLNPRPPRAVGIYPQKQASQTSELVPPFPMVSHRPTVSHGSPVRDDFVCTLQAQTFSERLGGQLGSLSQIAGPCGRFRRLKAA